MLRRKKQRIKNKKRVKPPASSSWEFKLKINCLTLVRFHLRSISHQIWEAYFFQVSGNRLLLTFLQ